MTKTAAMHFGGQGGMGGPHGQGMAGQGGGGGGAGGTGSAQGGHLGGGASGGVGGGSGPAGGSGSGSGREVKPHQCQQCLKSFSSNHQLVQHIRVHTGEKPYKCSYCDRRFKQLSHVQQHTRLHTGKHYSNFRLDHVVNTNFRFQVNVRTSVTSMIVVGLLSSCPTFNNICEITSHNWKGSRIAPSIAPSAARASPPRAP